MKGHEFYATGDYENAVEAYRSAIAMYRKYSPDGRDVRTVEPYLGLALVEAGDDLAARPLLEDACDFWKGRQASRYARGLCALATHGTLGAWNHVLLAGALLTLAGCFGLR